MEYWTVKKWISSKKTKSAHENDAVDLYKMSGKEITEWTVK